MKNLRIEQLAAEVGLSVSTVRYYQANKLIPRPHRQGRLAFYDGQHMARLKEIQQLSQQGFTIRQLKSFLNGTSNQDPILKKLAAETPLSKKALIQKSGVDSVVVELAIQHGLLPSVPNSATPKYYPDAVSMLSAVGKLLDAGIDAGDLLMLAQNHNTNISKTANAAVEMFIKSCNSSNSEGLSREELSQEIERLMIQTVTLVAAHFRQTLYARAAEYVSKSPIRKQASKAKGKKS